MRRATVAAAAVMASVVATGCGERQEPLAGLPPPISHEQYVRRANAICSQLGRETRALADRSFAGGPPSPPTLRAYEREARALQERRLAQLRALPAPPGERPRVVAIYDAWAAVLRDLARTPGDDHGRRPPASLVRFRRLAGGYGLTVCAGAADGP